MDRSRIAACTLGLRMLDLEQALKELQALGIQGADLWQVSPYYDNKGHINSDWDEVQRITTRRMLKEHGLTPVHLAAYGGGDFHNPDMQAQFRDLAWTNRIIDAAVDMTIPLMRIGTGRKEDPALIPQVAFLIKKAADHARNKPIKLVIETHPNTLAANPELIEALFNAIDKPNVGLLYDPGNLAANHEYKTILERFGDKIWHVHAKNVHLDANGEVAGWAKPSEGAVDYDWVMQKLEAIGYTGPIAIEYETFAPDATREEARQGLQDWLDYLS